MKKVDLLQGFSHLQKSLEANISLARFKFPNHAPTTGEEIQAIIIDFLRSHLPNRYNVDSGFVIDKDGEPSEQIDIIIFDNLYNPSFFKHVSSKYNENNYQLIPAEAVYAVIEVKTIFNESQLRKAGDKAASVRKLNRTSAPIVHAGGKYSEKQLHDIVSGIIAVEWQQSFSREDISKNLDNYISNLEKNAEARIDCGWILNTGSFDKFDGKLNIKEDYAIMYFLLRLLSRLQTIGSAPAADWMKYIENFESQIINSP